MDESTRFIMALAALFLAGLAGAALGFILISRVF